MTLIWSAYLVAIALLAGSFINLAADRLPRGESVVQPRSHCRSCGRRLNFLDLIPVGGYLLRRGRCATCGAPIGVAAPAVEALSGVAMAIPVAMLGPVRGSMAGLALVAMLGVAAVSDAYARRRA